MAPRFLTAIVLAACLACPPPAAAAGRTAGNEVGTVMSRAIEAFIRPGYAAFAAAAAMLVETADALCEAPGPEAQARARDAFRQAALAWADVEFVRFGPVMSENRLERVLFWPDRKGVGLRQAQATIATEDASASDPATLKGKSVAVQGLGALEYALFGTGSEQLSSGFRCAYVRAIASNLRSIAGELVAQWADPDGVSAYWTADTGDGGYSETLNQLVGTLVHGLEAVRDTRLRPFLDRAGGADRPRSALFWRSRTTLPMMRADIEGLGRLFAVSDMKSLLPEDARSVADSVAFEFRQAANLLPPDDRDMEAVLADGAARQRLVLLDLVLGSLIERLDRQFAPAAGLSSGFSFADGD